MSGPATLALLLLTPAAPVPVGPPAPAPVADPAKAAEFGNLVYAAAMQVASYRRDVEIADLAAGAVRGLFETAGRPAPVDLVRAVRDAKRPEERITFIGEARSRLVAAPQLRGMRAYLAAVNGFRHAFDQLSGVATYRNGQSVSVEMDFRLGFELDGVQGERVTAYRLDRLLATGQIPPIGLFEPSPRPDAVPSPATLPWRVRRVVPGSAANRAGVRPGDVITQLGDDLVTPATADRLFARLVDPPDGGVDPVIGLVRPVRTVLHVRRGAAEPIRIQLETEDHTPTNVTGVVLRADGTWDGMLDLHHKIGYLRVGAMEWWQVNGVDNGSHLAAAEIVTELAGRGCRGLVLDLRWCPGGYVVPAVALAGMFLPPETTIARVELLPRLEGGFGGIRPSVYKAAATGPRFTGLPLAVLVGPETVGGGELIAAALQEPGRAVVVGQRTAGRGATQELISLGLDRLQFKATYGTTLRPSGRPRHRTPTSSPTDDWGIRPDPGLEVPLTPALAAEVKGWAEEHELRRAGDRTALAFDDPDRDPVRLAALAHLRRRLGTPNLAPAMQ